MAKIFRFLCKSCDGYFETPDKKMPICRRCIQNGEDPALFGQPKPTPLQEAKWEKARWAKKELKL